MERSICLTVQSSVARQFRKNNFPGEPRERRSETAWGCSTAEARRCEGPAERRWWWLPSPPHADSKAAEGGDHSHRGSESPGSFVDTERVSKELWYASTRRLLICGGFARARLSSRLEQRRVAFRARRRRRRSVAGKGLVNKVIRLGGSLGSFVLRVGS